MAQNSVLEPDDAAVSVIIWPKDDKEMIYISGGTFIMGSNSGDENHQPEHQIEVADFYIDRWPITNAEYKRFADDTGYDVPNYDVSWCDTQPYNWNSETRMYPEGKNDHPVVLVTWEDAMAYAAWAGKRLPTEAEWERAARGPNGMKYPWGNDFFTGYCNCKETGQGGTSPVGYFSPNGDTPEGIVDMVGNVWEWVNSLFKLYPYDADDGRESREAKGFRVLRGSSWRNDANVVNGVSRLDGDFQFFDNVGFRCAVSPE